MTISHAGKEEAELKFTGTSQDELIKLVEKVIAEQKLDVFSTDPLTSISIRDRLGNSFGKMKTASFRGMTGKAIAEVIYKAVAEKGIKLFVQHEPEHIIRIQIVRTGEKTKYLNLHETAQDEVIQAVREAIELQKLSVFVTGPSTRVNIRDCIGGKNGKSKSLSFKGLTTAKTLSVITKHITK
jgi:2-hydroxy-3-keto-5-methylthiopentenyl-1-phosphate phosphatase